MLGRLNFRKLCDSKLSGLRTFDDMSISLSLKGDISHKGREYSYVINDTHRPRKYPHHQNINTPPKILN